MIDEIHVENLALIRSATLTPCAGLSVLTGETGAGKTALLSACKLLMGERASASMVRDGEDSLSVSGRFFLQEEEDERDLVVTRRVGADGRSRVTLDGRMASAGELAAQVGAVVDLCGQHEHQRLLKAASHVTFLDAWAREQIAPAYEEYAAAFEAAAAAASALEQVRAAASSSSAQLDEARFVLRRVDEVKPQLGEYEELVDALAKAENAEALINATEGAFQALSGDEGSALDALNTAIYLLDQASRYDAALADRAKTLREAVYAAEDVAADVRDYRDSVDLDQAELARMQERVSAMQSLLRSFGPTMEDVLAARDKAAELVSLVDDSAERLAAAEKAVEQAERQLAATADSLDKARKKAAPGFAKAVTAQMARLCMGGAQLVCEISRQDRKAWTKMGPSSVEFLFKPGADMAARPLARIASGGEVSRVMLALKVVLGQRDAAETLIFDEVDAGVGGATAVALADVLADLATTHQVIVVTHLAQVAVRAQAHYVVAKQGKESPETTITAVEGSARVEEIARMLSGDTSAASLAHAAELLAQ